MIALSGHKGSGKSTIATELATAIGGVRVSFGAYVRSQARDQSPRALADFGATLFATLGPERLLAHAIAASSWTGIEPLIIEGVRHSSVLQAIQKRFPRARHVFVDVPAEVRRPRVQQRDHLSEHEVTALDEHEIEQGIDALRPKAQVVIAGASQPAAQLAQAILNRVLQYEDN